MKYNTLCRIKDISINIIKMTNMSKSSRKWSIQPKKEKIIILRANSVIFYDAVSEQTQIWQPNAGVMLGKRLSHVFFLGTAWGWILGCEWSVHTWPQPCRCMHTPLPSTHTHTCNATRIQVWFWAPSEHHRTQNLKTKIFLTFSDFH